MNSITFEYDNLHQSHHVYSGSSKVKEIQDYLGQLSSHPAPGHTHLIWKFEPGDLPLLEWEIEAIHNKLKELNNES